jgi:hypothetical protein
VARERHCAPVGLRHQSSVAYLRLVGKLLANPPPVYHSSNGGRMITVETWLTDVYRCNERWIEMPSVEDVESIERARR